MYSSCNVESSLSVILQVYGIARDVDVPQKTSKLDYGD